MVFISMISPVYTKLLIQHLSSFLIIGSPIPLSQTIPLNPDCQPAGSLDCFADDGSKQAWQTDSCMVFTDYPAANRPSLGYMSHPDPALRTQH